MFIRKLLLFILFLTCCSKAFSAVFTVTSNADTGPGSFRDALIGAKIIDNDDSNPIQIKWTDANGKIWGHNLDLKNVPAGSYLLTVNSKSDCSQTYGPVILQDQNRTIPPPSINNIALCGPGETFLNVNDPIKDYSYDLYDSETAITPLAKSALGRFRITIEEDKTYFVSQAFFNCESTRIMVQVLLGLEKSSIPNAITPNGDGVNDYWNIKELKSTQPPLYKYLTVMVKKAVDMKG